MLALGGTPQTDLGACPNAAVILPMLDQNGLMQKLFV